MKITLWCEKRQLTSSIVSDMLALVSIDLAADKITTWTPNELALVADWCMREHARASDNIVRRRPRPAIIDLSGAKPIDYRGIWPAVQP